MAEYTSTAEGFARAMLWSLTGPPEEAADYVNAVCTTDFVQILNDKTISYAEHIEHLKQSRATMSNYKPTLKEFLRDGNLLAARLTGTITMGEVDMEWESFMFAEVDPESQKIKFMRERALWGPIKK